ncbi:hypothetical protein I4U23_013916 [Adineta vaga]|nr:hypothetical protein I4U23_013916 [Adineta vaga]
MAEPNLILINDTPSTLQSLEETNSPVNQSNISIVEEPIQITTNNNETSSDIKSSTTSLLVVSEKYTPDYHTIMSNVRLELLRRNAHTRCCIDEGDNDSFDDDDEATTMKNSLCSSISAVTSNYNAASCPICFESARLQSSSCCTFQCCNSCWYTHVSTTINDGRIKVSCISNDCSKYLTKESILNFIRYDSILHDRYLKLYINANQNPRAKTCPRCSHLYSLDEINGQNPNKKLSKKDENKKIPKQVQCSECSLVWCFRCAAPWHANLTCKQFAKGDKLLLKWINQKNEDQWNARKCPKCASFIQRAGGCPHMTCSSCQCEFCYLCGRRYCKIPVVGHHNNKFSMFGCPYILHPEKPWLRRTIRGTIATSLIVASPVIVAGALTAAVTVLPTFGVYKLVKHIRARRRAVILSRDHVIPDLLEEREFALYHEQLDTDSDDLVHNADEFQIFRQQLLELETPPETLTVAFPLSIFADMDVENLFTEQTQSISDNLADSTTSADDIQQTFPTLSMRTDN